MDEDDPDVQFESREKLIFEVEQENPESLGWAYRRTLYEVKETTDGRLTITSIFPSIAYGVSSIAPLEPETAIEIAGALVDWANLRGSSRDD